VTTTVRPLSAALLFAQPARVAPRLAPDGQRLSWLAPVDGALNLWVADRSGENPRVITDVPGRGMAAPSPVAPGYVWLKDSRTIVYFLDGDGDEHWRPHLVNVDTGVTRTVTQRTDAVWQFLRHHRDDTGRVLLAANDRDPHLFDAHVLDVASATTTRVFTNPGFTSIAADGALVVRAATSMSDDGTIRFHVRDGEDDDWRVALEIADGEPASEHLVHVSDDGQQAYAMTSVDADTSRPVMIDTASGAWKELAQASAYDAADLRLHPVDGLPQWVELFGARRDRFVLDPGVEDGLALADAVTDVGDVDIVSRSDDDLTWLVADIRSDATTIFHVVDRSQGRSAPLFRSRDDLDNVALASMEPFTYTARDGVEIEGYLTFPADGRRTSLSGVLSVHGGPVYRDYWGFDPLSQMLASRGHLTVKVNYRGSYGYGKTFTALGNRQWAAAMHTDLLDAVDHLARLGVLDPDRVAITGGSYGGYATMVAATFTPTVFRAAAAVVAPVNLETLIRSFPAYWGPTVATWHRRIGDPDTEADVLWSRSPLSRAADVVRPLMIVQTTNDPRVTVGEAEQMVAALKANGVEHEYLLIDGEGHGFTKESNRIEVYDRLVAFLDQHRVA